ncbi:hypothetical protein [Staphylococcus aureus]|uniref:hypothetical protein n=1 Tax=Staphylococcus aureus TaxID=1280 RepID=UPI0016526B3E|nr:hypothetical protein [Staphylococcus aureus]
MRRVQANGSGVVNFCHVEHAKTKSKHKEKWLGEVKTIEPEETIKYRNEFSRAK